MDNGEDDESETVEDVIQAFLQANRETFLDEPALALERIDRFLKRFPEMAEADRQRLRSAVLNGIH